MSLNHGRPEHLAPPDLYYNEVEARKYAMNSRMMQIQTTMSERAIELLELPPHLQPSSSSSDSPSSSALILDIGCGSGLSGEALTDKGFNWIGLDISPAMLSVARARDVDGDLICHDIGQGLPFRPGIFDGAISISVLQWLCNADMKTHQPVQRLRRFFSSLYSVLRRGSRAVFQFYPETPEAMSLITEAAMRAGFSGGLVVDFPEAKKAKKIYLVLVAGEGENTNIEKKGKIPSGKEGNTVDTTDADEDQMDDDSTSSSSSSTSSSTSSTGSTTRNQILFQRVSASTKRELNREKRRGEERGDLKRSGMDWVKRKKEKAIRRGKSVPKDSKYTGRTRGPKF